MTTTHEQDDRLPDAHVAARREAAGEMREIASQLSAVGDRTAATVVLRIVDSIDAPRPGTEHPPAPAFPSELSGDHLHVRENAIRRLGEVTSKLRAVGDYDAAAHVYGSMPLVDAAPL